VTFLPFSPKSSIQHPKKKMQHSNYHNSLRELMEHGNVTQALRHLADNGSYPNGMSAGVEFRKLLTSLPLVAQKLGIGS
jgi:hypothetical protein